jgi:hypothetical protein
VPIFLVFDELEQRRFSRTELRSQSKDRQLRSLGEIEDLSPVFPITKQKFRYRRSAMQEVFGKFHVTYVTHVRPPSPAGLGSSTVVVAMRVSIIGATRMFRALADRRRLEYISFEQKAPGPLHFCGTPEQDSDRERRHLLRQNVECARLKFER